MHWMRNWRKNHVYHWSSINSMFKLRFGGLREQVIKRDNEKCVLCGMTRESHKKIFGRDITVDHIDKKGRNSIIKNNSLDNLQTLCLRCHGWKDNIKDGKHSLYRPILIGGDV